MASGYYQSNYTGAEIDEAVKKVVEATSVEMKVVFEDDTEAVYNIVLAPEGGSA